MPGPTNTLSLHHLTVREVPPTELIDIAAALGCTQVGVFVAGTGRASNPFQMIEDAATLAAVRARMAATGVAVHNLEVFPLRPATSLEKFRPGLEMGAALGAPRLTAQIHDPDMQRATDNFRGLCAMAREYGILVHIEFTGFAVVNTLAKTRAFLDAAGEPDATAAIDALHLYRNGETPADVAALTAQAPHRIGYAQICDGPPGIDPDQALDEAIYNRLLPGQGCFDMPAFAAALPDTITIDVECPSRTLEQRGLTPLERAAAAVQAARVVLGGRV